jgi:hypothetical protein
VWKGDQVTASVAAASIVAKVTRDRMMVALDEHYPAYGFARHKGYSTPEHMSALCAYGPCPEHRYSYTNVIQANRRWATGWQPDAPLDEGTVIDEDAVIEDGADLEGADLEGGGSEDFRLAPADGSETAGGWADLVTREIAGAEGSQTGSAWADTSQAETRLGDAARAEERRMDPWLRSGYGAPPGAGGPRDGGSG